ncbi:C-type lectin domain family 10 member A-like [Rana temporaria]|uniref:C-type lectin domain family 10 member A-like n=1 Tax=Rana temporaria TaxID=8407 RepID=UPI001AADDF1F|nr:C-type lectin domain family 10 member A-like [Rana temporaria]
MVLVILLVLKFLLLLLLTGLVLHYKSMAEDGSHPKNNNGSPGAICGIDWTCHESSCYYFSFRIMTWMMAQKDCEDMGAHLLVINSKEETIFIEKLSYGMLVWIGLTDRNGTWKWVDGTSYASTDKFWHLTQPDNWNGHENGEGEHCATITPYRKWNDDNCSRRIPYICEKKLS